MSFGWTWAETERHDATVLYGDPAVTRAYSDVLNALRARGVPAVAATASGRPYLHADLADGGHVEMYDADLEELPIDRAELRAGSRRAPAGRRADFCTGRTGPPTCPTQRHSQRPSNPVP